MDELIAELPEGAVLTDRDVVASYRQDWARDPDAGWPRAVVRATCTEDVQAVLRWASANKVPVVPRGAGSGLSGGSTAVEDGIVLSLEKMRDIRIDPVSRVAITQPGLLNVEVKRAAAEHGLWYPPDPSSFEMCSIGGNAATNAGGLCCVKYGVTTDYVLGMQVVLADGTALRLGGPRLKDVAGLSLTKLFVGSEGLLGVITELTLRLVPAQPPACTLVAVFPSIEAAADAVLAITTKLRPSMLELMDRTSINAVEDYTSMGLDRYGGGTAHRAFGRARGGRGAGDRHHGEGLPRARRRRGVHDLRPRRGRGVRRSAACRVPRAGEAGLAAARGRRRRAARPARPRPRHREDRREARGRHRRRRARRRRQHATRWSSTTRPTPTRPSARTPRSARSWTSRSSSAGRSPASTASAG